MSIKPEETITDTLLDATSSTATTVDFPLQESSDVMVDHELNRILLHSLSQCKTVRQNLSRYDRAMLGMYDSPILMQFWQSLPSGSGEPVEESGSEMDTANIATTSTANDASLSLDKLPADFFLHLCDISRDEVVEETAPEQTNMEDKSSFYWCQMLKAMEEEQAGEMNKASEGDFELAEVPVLLDQEDPPISGGSQTVYSDVKSSELDTSSDSRVKRTPVKEALTHASDDGQSSCKSAAAKRRGGGDPGNEGSGNEGDESEEINEPIVTNTVDVPKRKKLRCKVLDNADCPKPTLLPYGWFR